MQWRQSSEPQFQRTRIPRLLAPWLHLIHTEPGRQLLQSERDEADLDRQQRQGEGVPRAGGQGQAEVLLDGRQRERQEHQVAKRPEVQQRQMVQHWRVSWTLFTSIEFPTFLFSELGEHSLTTGRAMRTAWPSSTTSTTMASGESNNNQVLTLLRSSDLS